MEPEPLTLLDREEWFDICRKVCPNLTRDEYQAMWADFQQRKQAGLIGPQH